MTSIGLVLYSGFTALDIVGPFQTLVDVPGMDVDFIAERRGLVTDHSGRLALDAGRAFDEVSALDVLIVPGGLSNPAAEGAQPVVDFITRVHPGTAFTTSVCTGSLFLGRAGVLDGLRATCHWAWAGELATFGATYSEERVVVQGKVITAAGVSSGIDMGLVLLSLMAGEDVAKAMQLAIEYDPQPPFDAGAPGKVAPDLRERVRGLIRP